MSGGASKSSKGAGRKKINKTKREAGGSRKLTGAVRKKAAARDF